MKKTESFQITAESLFGGLSNPYSWLKDAENKVERYAFEFLTDDRATGKTRKLAALKEETKRLQEKAAELLAAIEQAQEYIEAAED